MTKAWFNKSVFLKKPSTCTLIGVLLLFALCYYGFYYRCSLYPAGEGGLEGVIALRLIQGQLPIKEVVLGYNVLWFYPIVGLFKIFGPSYTFLRIYFFFIATCTSLLVFWIIKMATRRSGLAFLGSLLVLMLPGQLFRNYMAFLVVLNMTSFLKTFFSPHKTPLKKLLWMTATGGILGLTFLTRIDLGYLLSLIFIGLTFFNPWIEWSNTDQPPLQKRVLLSFTGFFLATLMGFLLHAPFYYDAVHRGFSTPFLEQYEQFPLSLINKKGNLLKFLNPKREEQTVIFPPSIEPSSPQKQQPTTTPTFSHQEKITTLARYSFSAHKWRERLVAFNLYLPIIVSILLILIGLILFFTNKRNIKNSHPLLCLTCLACSLTLFPQYFFWRPDMVHLSEFMVPMIATILIALCFALEAYRKASFFVRLLIVFFCFCSTLSLLLYLDNALQSQSTGGIAISHHRKIEFQGANGVAVKLTSSEFEDTVAIYKSITTHSQPGEYVICYPYNPEINFMTDRPSYRQNLYIDDLTAPSDFDSLTIAEIEKYHPAAIVITDWAINGTEHSRFTHWAAEAYDYIKTHYITDYEHGIIHVFVRQN